MSSFDDDKITVIESLSSVSKEASDEYNRLQEGLSNGLFTAATAYIALVLAFASSARGLFGQNAWVVLASIFSFSASLIPWAAEKIISSIVYGQRIKISSTLASMVGLEARDDKSLAAINKVAVKLLPGGRTSLVPLVSQIILFILGVLFAVTAIAVILLQQ